MSSTLIPIKSFLGKYYTELLYSTTQEKYNNTALDTIFDQRFYIQGNKTQMVVDYSLPGLQMSVSGNEIYISNSLYNHPNVIVTNSIEAAQSSNPKSFYNPETFSTIAYLICQNHTTLQIVGEIDEPIYVRYNADYETFYNSVITFDIQGGIEVEIIEEIESHCALNAVSNYVLHPFAELSLTTFYKNSMSGISIFYRDVVVQESAKYTHTLLGKGSSNIIDENKIHTYEHSQSELLGVVNSDNKNFHSILYVIPKSADYKISVDYRDILDRTGLVTFFPAITGTSPSPDTATITVSNISLTEIPMEHVSAEVHKYIDDIISRTITTRITGAERFYLNKSDFLHLP